MDFPAHWLLLRKYNGNDVSGTPLSFFSAIPKVVTHNLSFEDTERGRGDRILKVRYNAYHMTRT